MINDHPIEVKKPDSPIFQPQSQMVTGIIDSKESSPTHSLPIKENIDAESTISLPQQKTKEQEGMAILFHELRTSLSGILGMTQLVRESLDRQLAEIETYRDNLDMQCDLNTLYGKLQSNKEKLKTIESCGKEQLTILNNVLDFNKLDQSKVALESKPFAILRDICKPLMNTYGPICEEKDISLSTNFADIDPQLKLIGDLYRLKQILNNLMSNAFKFAKPPAKGPASIELSLSMQSVGKNKQLHIKIKNTGPGLRDSQLKQLFKPYTQSDSSITRLIGGTGLGLVVCKQLLNLMGGEIDCTSSVEQEWVQFDIHLALPIARNLHHPRKSSEEKIKSSRSKIQPDLNVRVLVVEDNKVNQEIIARMLKKFGCLVDIAENGQQAIDLYSKKIYSMILMDIQMPVMDGLTATREIRSLEKAKQDSSLTPIPIIGLSADAMSDQQKIALKAGMNDYLTKPINAKVLYVKMGQFSHQTSSSESPSSDDQKLERPQESRKLSIPRHSPSSSLFTRRSSSVGQATRISQDSGSGDSSYRMRDSFEGVPTPTSATDHPLFFAMQPRLGSFQQPDKLLDNKILLTKTLTSTSETEMTTGNSFLESPPIQWIQQLEEAKGDLIEKVQVMSRAIDYYFRAVLQDNCQSIAHVSMTVSALPKEELKKWIVRLETFYLKESPPSHQPLIAAVALGHWQSLRDQVMHQALPQSNKSSLLQAAEMHLNTWRQRTSLPEKRPCCIIA